MHNLRWLSIAALVLLPGIAHADEGERLERYSYEETKRLVSFVDDAAALIERKGEFAFQDFNVPGSKWLTDDYYVFVYSPDGTNVFHPVETQLMGRDLRDLRDMNGKPVVQMITDVAKKPERDASDWVFYLWEYKTQLIPLWKSSYIRKAMAPNGKIYLVGSGLYNLKTERVFVHDRVALACNKLQSEGKDAAFKEFRDPASPFVFLGAYIFVLDANRPHRGRSVVPEWRRARSLGVPRRSRNAGRQRPPGKAQSRRRGVGPVSVAEAGKSGADAQASVCPQGDRRRRDLHCRLRFLPGHSNLDARLGIRPV